jgi:hypothetical protein
VEKTGNYDITDIIGLWGNVKADKADNSSRKKW